MNEKRIVALSIDKVQTFLTEAVHAQVQEKQTEEATLKSIMNASREVAFDFYQTIREAFTGVEIRELMSCSGVFIFSCMLPAEGIESKLNQLFLKYYDNSNGQKMLRCVSFPAGDYNEIEAIQKAKKQLKRSGQLNDRIEKNRDVLFSFCETGKETFRYQEDHKDYPMFAKDINALYRKEVSDNSNHFRMAVIKADLDGMGKMFQNIGTYEAYCAVSKLLNEEVSLDGLAKSMTEHQPDDRTGWLFPFYIAGDDIFFAVSVADLIRGIDVCREILGRINKKLLPISGSLQLTISIGVEITFNREPVRYYMDLAEKQLQNAKATSVPEVLKEFLRTKISICGLAFLDIDYNRLKEQKRSLGCLNGRKGSGCQCAACKKKRLINREMQAVPIWNYFLSDIYRLNAIRAEKGRYRDLLGNPGFFYTLLERLSEEAVQKSDIKYINNVLYHLSPKFLDTADPKLQELELALNAGILSQLLIRDKNGRNGMVIKVEGKTRHRLECYLRLLLLFSEGRFQLTKGLELQKKLQVDKVKLENARKYLFTKSVDYLYGTILRDKNAGLRDIFAKTAVYQVKGKRRMEERPCLQRLKIEKSMFVRLRNTHRVSVDKAADMIELQNPTGPKAREEIDRLNQERREKEKAPCYLYFEKDRFRGLAGVKDAWDSDFVDSLMLLYEYKEMSIQLKGRLNAEKRKEH